MQPKNKQKVAQGVSEIYEKSNFTLNVIYTRILL